MIYECFRLVLWTAVMNKAFKSDSKTQNQANCESAFNVIKNVIFDGVRLPIRADIFVKKHIESIVGNTKHMITVAKGSLNEIKHRKDEKENWYDKANKKVKRIDQFAPLMMMPNDYMNNQKRNEPYFVNMCAFDAVLHSIALCYLDSTSFKDYLDSQVEGWLQFWIILIN